MWPWVEKVRLGLTMPARAAAESSEIFCKTVVDLWSRISLIYKNETQSTYRSTREASRAAAGDRRAGRPGNVGTTMAAIRGGLSRLRELPDPLRPEEAAHVPAAPAPVELSRRQ